MYEEGAVSLEPEKPKTGCSIGESHGRRISATSNSELGSTLSFHDAR